MLSNISFGQLVTKTVGSSGADFTTIKGAFDAVNAGIIKGAITLQILSSTTETASATLNASGTLSSSYSSILIYPTVSNCSITGSLNSYIVGLSGADNVTIDGRVNQSGSASLVITNTLADNASRTINFVNDATYNTIKYCIIKGSALSSSYGVIMFSTSNLSTGNDFNTIDHCEITNSGSRPFNIINSAGSTGKDNSGNVISNNSIHDFFNPNNHTYGICITGASSDFLITGNSFYETTTIAPSGAYTYSPIRIVSSTNNTVSNNYIGGSAPLCGGTPLTVNSSFPHYFVGINASGSSSGATTVQNNIIRNIDYTSTQSNPWDGIYINAGNVNVTGNTIGDVTGTGSIKITTPLAAATTTLSGGVVTSIAIIGGGTGYTATPVLTFSSSGSSTSATATATISGGSVTGYTLTGGGSGYTSAPTVIFDGSTYSTSHGIRGSSTGITNIIDNNVGSITTAGSDYYSHGFECLL